MVFGWKELVAMTGRYAPEGSPRRKLLQILAIVLLFEGFSVLILFSKVGLPLGIVSLALGMLILLLVRPEVPSEEVSEKKPTPGIWLVDSTVRALGGPYALMLIGVVIISMVIVFNRLISQRPEYGDLDTLSLMFGGLLVVYPFAPSKFKVEVSFALLFLAIVVILLVVPQAVSSASGDDGDSPIGGWYVHYMLAAPFAGMLNLLGIDASSSGSFVTLEFRDGSVHTLGISAYCAGLYSFSIFLAAFFAFVLVFERLPKKTLAIVMAIGLLIAYLGNLLRMVVIGVVGYYEGMNALLWAHENVGWIIFLSWSAVFWYVLLDFISRRAGREASSTEAN